MTVAFMEAVSALLSSKAANDIRESLDEAVHQLDAHCVILTLFNGEGTELLTQETVFLEERWSDFIQEHGGVPDQFCRPIERCEETWGRRFFPSGWQGGNGEYGQYSRFHELVREKSFLPICLTDQDGQKRFGMLCGILFDVEADSVPWGSDTVRFSEPTQIRAWHTVQRNCSVFSNSPLHEAFCEALGEVKAWTSITSIESMSSELAIALGGMRIRDVKWHECVLDAGQWSCHDFNTEQLHSVLNFPIGHEYLKQEISQRELVLDIGSELLYPFRNRQYSGVFSLVYDSVDVDDEFRILLTVFLETAFEVCRASLPSSIDPQVFN